MRFSSSFLLGGLFVLALGAGALTAACADSEPPDVPNYGPPNGLAAKTPNQPASSGGTSSGGSSSGGGDDAAAASGDGGAPPTAEFVCQMSGGTIVDAGPCAVSWTTDLYPAMQSGGAYNCASAACHAVQAPILTGTASAYYATLANYVSASILSNSNPYFNPCSTNPASSNFVCNTEPTGSATLCGNAMPLGTPIADAGMIATWVACGAPQN